VIFLRFTRLCKKDLPDNKLCRVEFHHFSAPARPLLHVRVSDATRKKLQSDFAEPCTIHQEL